MTDAHSRGSDRAALTARAAMASVAVALTLAVLKGWAAWSSGSTAMLGSLADTALDLLASVITFFGVRFAAMPADDNHRFGHGKAEAMVAFIQVNIIILSAIGIGWRAIDQWISGAVMRDPAPGIGVSIIAIALTLALLAYQRRVIARTHSVAIAADQLHYSSDLALNGAVIAALVIDYYLGVRGADPAFALAIAGWLLWGALRSANHALAHLMDGEWAVERKRRLLDLLDDFPESSTIHQLKTRSSGTADFVQFHIWFPADTSIADAHDVMSRMEAKIVDEWPDVEVMIHPEPNDDQLEPIAYTPSEMLARAGKA